MQLAGHTTKLITNIILLYASIQYKHNKLKSIPQISLVI